MCKIKVLVFCLVIASFTATSSIFALPSDNYYQSDEYGYYTLKGNLKMEEYEGDLWAFFLDLDPKVYDKVIRKFFAPDRSYEDKIVGVKATVGLLRLHNEILPASVIEHIISDEDFLNALLWDVRDVALKAYALKLMILDIGINNGDTVVDVFNKYKNVDSLSYGDEKILKDILVWYIRDQRDFIDNTKLDYASRMSEKNTLKNNIEEIRFIVNNSSWINNDTKEEFKTAILNILKEADSKEPVSFKKGKTPKFRPYSYFANSFTELQEALNANQVSELRNILLTKNSEELLEIFDNIENFNLKQDIIKFALGNVQKEKAFDVVSMIIEMYQDKEYLNKVERSLIHVTLASARDILTNDELVNAAIDLEHSEWFGNIGTEDLTAFQLGILSSLKVSENDNVLRYWRKIRENSLIHYRCSKGIRTDFANKLELFLTSFGKDVITIFKEYKDVKNFTTHDGEILSILLDYVDKLNNVALTSELLNTIEGSVWLDTKGNQNNDKIKEKVGSLKSRFDCISKFM